MKAKENLILKGILRTMDKRRSNTNTKRVERE